MYPSIGAQASHPFSSLGSTSGRPGEGRAFEHASSLPSHGHPPWDAERCPLLFSVGLDPSGASGRQRQAEKDLGQSSLGTSGFGAFRCRELWLRKEITGRQ